MMKKFFYSLAIVPVFTLCLLSALTVVPHVHGNDTDHSRHESCPIHQVSMAHNDAAIAAAVSLIFCVLILWLVSAHPQCSGSFETLFASLRAPPAIS